MCLQCVLPDLGGTYLQCQWCTVAAPFRCMPTHTQTHTTVSQLITSYAPLNESLQISLPENSMQYYQGMKRLSG